jgi:membrane protein DedA with SNARE-associated domain
MDIESTGRIKNVTILACSKKQEHMIDFFQTLFEWYMANLNYFTIALLMAIESTFLPLPSEVVIPFAAFKAAQGVLSFWGVVLFGTVGALCGSLINYSLAYYLGRPLIYKFADTRAAHFFLVTKEKVINAENYFIRNGKTSTFIGRLVPGIRHLISIPAGLAKMNLRDFMVYTFVGAGIWNIILAIVGFFMYEIREQILPYIGYILLGLGAGFVIWLIVKGRTGEVSD